MFLLRKLIYIYINSITTETQEIILQIRSTKSMYSLLVECFERETGKLWPIKMKVTVTVNGLEAISHDEQFKRLWNLSRDKTT